MKRSTRTLWAPGRLGYLRGLKRTRRSGRAPRCFLCEALDPRSPQADLVVAGRRGAFCILNKYPYNIGHLMVVPARHTADYGSLTAAEHAAMAALTREALAALKRFLDPDGFNIGTNVGRAGGAGLETHLHQHLVPRWNADTNFITVLGGTRVISMTLEDLRSGLRKAWRRT